MALYNLCSRCSSKVEYPMNICDKCKQDKEEEKKERYKEKNKKYNRDRYLRDRENNSYRLFYSSKEWRLKRDEIHRRDGICKVCEALYKFQPIDEIHHIEPLLKSFDKRLDNDNLVGLCKDHHHMIHNNNIDNKEKLNKFIKQLQNSDKFLKSLLENRD